MNFGLLVTAALLGVTHAAEPDHVAGVVGLTGDTARSNAAVVGACFATGHAVLVVVWLGLATLVFDRLPALTSAFGATALGAVLLFTGGLLAADALRSRQTDGHAHAHPVLARTDGGTRRLLAFGIVGALFTLSPPLTMLGFVTAVVPTAGAGGAWLAVAAYAVAIVLAMSTIGAVGSTAVRWLGGRNERYAVAGKLVAALVLVSLGISTLV
ncbi:hypothetical protein [Halorarius litoreus]|uniref:hypothetical protein n=1 Tax=Halorarius litoreus TaxID=2962676 RepID=UPI0020CF857F|nr:hypothetical protein [Halorarius litoreus]